MNPNHVVGGVALRAGVRLVVGEADYLYGAGVVTLVVNGVDRIFAYAGENWVELHACEVMSGGVTVPRVVSVRVGALRSAVRHN
jgi:hypothetical protein